MAFALAEQVFAWSNSEAWPPSACLTKTDSYQVDGTVVSHFPLSVRKARYMQGYMRQASTAEELTKHHAIVLEKSTIVRLKDQAAVKQSEFVDALAPFIKLACGDKKTTDKIVTGKNEVVVWAEKTIVGDLKARKDATSDPLSVGTVVRITTYGSTTVAKTVEILKPGPVDRDPTGKPDVNVVDKSMAQFRAALANKSDKKKVEKDDDEWRDD